MSEAGRRFVGGRGVLILLGSIVGFAVYFYLVVMSPWSMLVIQVSAFLAVTAVLVSVAWIGYTMATLPVPGFVEMSMEEFEMDEGAHRRERARMVVSDTLEKISGEKDSNNN